MTPPAEDSPLDAELGAAASAGSDRAVLDALFTQAYDELRRLARTIRRHDAGATIDPTALVNAAWLKLAASPHGAAMAGSPLAFRRLVGRAMRQVLVDAARHRHAIRHGGRDAVFISLGTEAAAVPVDVADAAILDAALTDLARMSPRQAAIVESRFFAGLDVAETAQLLGVSESTVHRDWRAARAWLDVELRAERSTP